ncbi:TetR/AcrR family transcriptional regulator [Candidatus Binatus sp.]|uniref:TetR/AcrR family transcriptional regulator n=1 Tax=Candidatus Binatus sp. TaxID=2811406 RepID=UPI003CC66110
MFDGRKVRRHKNRHRIVAAMLELVRAGAISPRAEEVAERAGVGLRTVFRHFDDMDSLYREMADAMRRELQPLVSAPLGSPYWNGKLDEMVLRRAVLFERAMPFKNAADVHRHRSPFLRKDYETMRAAERDALEAALPAALRKNREFFEALDQALSFSTWQHLRRDQKLTQDQARQTVEFAVRALVAASAK